MRLRHPHRVHFYPACFLSRLSTIRQKADVLSILLPYNRGKSVVVPWTNMLRRLKSMFHTILVCSDGSNSALQAARAAAALARKLGSCLYMLNVMDDALFLSP